MCQARAYSGDGGGKKVPQEQREKEPELEFQVSHGGLLQTQVKQIQREKKALNTQAKVTEKLFKRVETALQDNQKHIADEQQSSLQQSLQRLLNRLKLERAKYHHGTLIGNYVHNIKINFSFYRCKQNKKAYDISDTL